MKQYIDANRDHWNETTPIHVSSKFYNVEGFKAGTSTLKSTELAEVGDVAGKTLLHLQCHFGLDTLSWARLGAKVTGVDFSEKAIDQARSLSQELNIRAEFVCCDVYDLPQRTNRMYDIVFTSYGVLCWLPDLKRWAEIIARSLKPGGFFYIVESHPLMSVFDNSRSATGLKVAYSYFGTPEPTRWDPEGDYAEKEASVRNPSYEWTHSMQEIVCSLIDAGLRIDFLHESPVLFYWWAPFTEMNDRGEWHVKGDPVPLVFSLKATKPVGGK